MAITTSNGDHHQLGRELGFSRGPGETKSILAD
jgi:hypothetical protein